MKLVLLIFFAIAQSLAAKAETQCVCEIGKDQKAIYRAGCNIWFSQKQCTIKKTIDRRPGTKLAQYVSKISRGDVLEIGYVGKWSDTQATAQYIEEHILPLIKIKDLRVVYENTGSFALSDPEGLQEEYLNFVKLPTNSKLLVKGSQGVSLGMWDQLFWGSANFYAFASTDWDVARFLDCTSQEGKKCSARFQKGDRGRCHDSKINRKIWLSCQKPQFGSGDFEWLRE